ncbi:VOC family protein [Ignatzschineria rhizosphaerae]|uniref:VOC family protein n=1 Tax=Ignatzschineria rhizosphaerae TaxID=2923279 RepID=A0ABY3X456_9GAMM|nr:VOC family protein [Ignatzschineria rhizosphaerae]UNM97055.1 VOC family protein [Ignatzschineria rhizosphaerae]
MNEVAIGINYIEFNVQDMMRSKQFYQQLGWQFIDYSPYYCEFNSGSLKGGFYQTKEISSKGGALVILYSENLEETYQTLKEAGATITSEIIEFPGGRRFQFRDLDGYELAVWSK